MLIRRISTILALLSVTLVVGAGAAQASDRKIEKAPPLPIIGPVAPVPPGWTPVPPNWRTPTPPPAKPKKPKDSCSLTSCHYTLSKSTTRSASTKFDKGGVAVASYVCSKIPDSTIVGLGGRLVCVIGVAAYATSMKDTFQYAASRSMCVRLGWIPIATTLPLSWKAVRC